VSVPVPLVPPEKICPFQGRLLNIGRPLAPRSLHLLLLGHSSRGSQTTAVPLLAYDPYQDIKEIRDIKVSPAPAIVGSLLPPLPPFLLAPSPPLPCTMTEACPIPRRESFSYALCRAFFFSPGVPPPLPRRLPSLSRPSAAFIEEKTMPFFHEAAGLAMQFLLFSFFKFPFSFFLFWRWLEP